MRDETANLSGASISGKWLAGWEIASVVVSCLLAEWIVLSFQGGNRWLLLVPVILALGLMIVSHRVYGESFRQLGFRLDNFLPAILLVLLPTLVAIAGTLIASRLMLGELSLAAFRPRFFLVFFWALFQQYVLQAYINRRAQMILRPGFPSIVLVGLIFGAVHLPNPVLAALTAVGGSFWAAVYQRHANLLALALSHAIVSILIAVSLPSSLVNSLRVGFKFFG
jgi:membrane protease YdiL (CAAX protease family)